MNIVYASSSIDWEPLFVHFAFDETVKETAEQERLQQWLVSWCKGHHDYSKPGYFRHIKANIPHCRLVQFIVDGISEAHLEELVEDVAQEFPNVSETRIGVLPLI